MSELPNGWTLACLGDLASYVNGKGFKKSEWKTEGIPIIRIQNLNKLSAGFNYASENNEEKYRVKSGDLLVAWSASLGAYIWNRGDAWLNQHIFRVDHDALIVDKQYLFYSVKDSIASLYGKTHGMGMVHVTKGKFEGHEVVLPPLNEQTRIAKKLDSLLAKVEAAQTRLEKIPTILKRFRQSVLAAATSGELTKGWRGDGEYDDKGFPVEWSYKKLKEIGELARGKSKHRPRNDPKLYDGEYPFIQTGDVARSGGLITSHKKTYSDFGLSQSRLFPEGTLCITIAANIADTSILTYPACFPDSVVGFIVVDDLCDNLFIKYLVDIYKNHLELLAPATAQKNINLAILNSLDLPMPDIKEQKEIVRRVESLFTLADTVEKQYNEAKKRIDKLTQSILAKAFKGELVPQDPDDEPAEKLLERIKVLREQESQKQPKKKRATNKTKKKQVKIMKLDDAPIDYLTKLIKKNDNKMWADELWKASNMSIDDFYEKLCQEVDDSLLVEAFDEPEDKMTEKRYLIAC